MKSPREKDDASSDAPASERSQNKLSMYAISLFKNKHDNSPQLAQRTWEQICANLARPAVRASKDGLLFSPATFHPAERKKANVKEISMLVLDYDHDSSLASALKVWEAMGLRFGVYTTHSHRRATDSNPNADDRFRMLIPLAEPIPSHLFASLWGWASSTSNGKIDGQAKDESRMFYTPVKATPDASYEYRIVDGVILDWRNLPLIIEGIRRVNRRREDAGATGSGYANWHALKAELGRRIMARGQRNGSGKWDAQARCHKGAGHSGVFYNPATNQTTCNKGCSEAAILRAEDLPQRPDRQTEGESWSAPTPFHEYDLPAFPVESLPDWLRQYVKAEARATQTPTDLAAMIALSVCAASCAKKAFVLVRDDWQEPLNIFTATVLPPAQRKSAVFRDTVHPLAEREQELAREKAAEISEAENHQKILEGRLRHLQQEAAKAKPNERGRTRAEADAVAREYAEAKVSAYPRFIADDCSPERLSTMLRDQRGRMSVLSAEGDVFDLMAGRYSPKNAPNFGVFLRGHAGDDLRVDRVGRTPEFVKAPALTVGLAVQPEVLRGLLEKPGFRGRGLLGRFLYSLPPSLLGHRDTRPEPMSKTVRSAYHRNVGALARLPDETLPDGTLSPRMLRLSSEAEVRIIEFVEWLEPQLAESGELGSITDWAGKLAGAVARVAGILHMVEHVDNLAPWCEPISERTMECAIKIGEYLIPHARAAYSEMGADPVVEEAKYVLRWIERKDNQAFTKRDAFEGLKGRFKRVADLDPALILLEDHGYIRTQEEKGRSGPGRKPSSVYEVNPLTRFAQFAEFAQIRSGRGFCE